jgi:putative DNA primase/helicase
MFATREPTTNQKDICLSTSPDEDTDDNSWAHDRGLRQRERRADAKIRTYLERQRREQPGEPPTQLRVLTMPRASELVPEKVHWLWERRFALGKLSLIGGAAGTGKSTLAMSLIAAVTSGGPWPCGEGRAPRGSAIILSAEDDEHDTISPRLLAAGADVTRVGVLSSVSDNAQRRPFDLRRDLGALELGFKDLGNVRLVVIDPISAYLGGVDANGNARVRALLQPLAALAARYGVAVVAITHPPKGLSSTPSDHFIGSIAFNAAARASYLVQIDPADETRRLLLQVKNNIAVDRGTLVFRIAEREATPGVMSAAVVWEEQRSNVTARELIARHRRSSATADAEAFLLALLDGGASMQVCDIEREARIAGLLRADQPISQCKPLRDARIALKLNVAREGFGAGARWLWAMEGGG